MIKAIHFPIDMAGHELDEYLARGWFRMGQTIFTTDFIPVGREIHPVYWLRFDLRKVQFEKKQVKLITSNKKFTVGIRSFNITDELEDLYAVYRSSIDFDAPLTVENYLLDGEENNIYDSRLVEIRDNGQLIAAGVFDSGKNSIAGIINFYHPAYKARSLGKYLMLVKINYGINSGKTFYYPGYIADGFPKFDYKLFPGVVAAELYDSKTEKWIPFTGCPDFFPIKPDL